MTTPEPPLPKSPPPPYEPPLFTAEVPLFPPLVAVPLTSPLIDAP